MLSFNEFLVQQNKPKQKVIKEAGLGGKSRTYGEPNWIAYVADNPNWTEVDYAAGTNGTVVDDDLKNGLTNFRNGDKIEILSLETKQKGKSVFARVRVNGTEGFTNINNIKKPADWRKGGKERTQTKGLSPDKFGINGVKMTAPEFVKAIRRSAYFEGLSLPVKEYMNDAIEAINGLSLLEQYELYDQTVLSEARVDRFSQTIRLPRAHTLDAANLREFDKNFNEVLGMFYILKTIRKAKTAMFPASIKEQLYDFIVYNQHGAPTWYSTKNPKGSSTSIRNIQFFLRGYEGNKKTTQVLLDLIRDGKTDFVISEFITKYYPSLLNYLKKTLGIRELSQGELTKAFNKLHKDENYLEILRPVYNELNYPLNDKTLESITQIFEKGYNKDNGWLIFPLGSFIVKDLNKQQNVLDELNEILNTSAASGVVHQITVGATNKELTFKIIRFKNNKFKFSYNAGMKYPNNRPIGFIEVK